MKAGLKPQVEIMRLPTLFFALMLSVVMPVQADNRVDVGATIVDGNIRNFYLAIGEYYRVPEQEVTVIRDRHIPHQEVPVVLYIAQRANVEPGVIVDLRLKGKSWMAITLRFGLGPDIYYVPMQEVSGPPYGRAYGHYKNKPKKQWKNIKLDDDEIVNLVNLRFISDRYKYAPDVVARMRSGGKDFVVINEDIRKSKAMSRDGWKEPEQRGDNGHGKSKEKHKNKHDQGDD